MYMKSILNDAPEVRNRKKNVFCVIVRTEWRETRKPEHERMKERQAFGVAYSFEIEHCTSRSAFFLFLL